MGLLRRRGATGTGFGQALSIPAVRQDAPLDGSDLLGAGLPHLGAGSVLLLGAARGLGFGYAAGERHGIGGVGGAGPGRGAAHPPPRHPNAAEPPLAAPAGHQPSDGPRLAPD